QDLCRPYIKNEEVYRCPSQSPHIAYGFWRPPGTPNPLIKDYLANAIWGFGGTPSGIAPLVINRVSYGTGEGRGVSGPFINNWYSPSKSLAEIEDHAGTIAIFDGARVFEIWRGEQTDAWHNVGKGCSWVDRSPCKDANDYPWRGADYVDVGP